MSNDIDPIDMEFPKKKIACQQVVGSRRVAAVKYQQRFALQVSCLNDVRLSEGGLDIDIAPGDG
jgi:hypothetical protein